VLARVPALASVMGRRGQGHSVEALMVMTRQCGAAAAAAEQRKRGAAKQRYQQPWPPARKLRLLLRSSLGDHDRRQRLGRLRQLQGRPCGWGRGCDNGLGRGRNRRGCGSPAFGDQRALRCGPHGLGLHCNGWCRAGWGERRRIPRDRRLCRLLRPNRRRAAPRCSRKGEVTQLFGPNRAFARRCRRNNDVGGRSIALRSRGGGQAKRKAGKEEGGPRHGVRR
jgi:hypothetical protein